MITTLASLILLVGIAIAFAAAVVPTYGDDGLPRGQREDQRVQQRRAGVRLNIDLPHSLAELVNHYDLPPSITINGRSLGNGRSDAKHDVDKERELVRMLESEMNERGEIPLTQIIKVLDNWTSGGGGGGGGGTTANDNSEEEEKKEKEKDGGEDVVEDDVACCLFPDDRAADASSTSSYTSTSTVNSATPVTNEEILGLVYDYLDGEGSLKFFSRGFVSVSLFY
jgi:hypothetical protein